MGKAIQVKTLFPLKEKSIHPSCVINKHSSLVYRDTCSCVETYIGDTIHRIFGY